MAIVEDVHAGGGVVLEVEGLQATVERRLSGDDVNGRLTGSIGDGEVITPLLRSWKCNITVRV